MPTLFKVFGLPLYYYPKDLFIAKKFMSFNDAGIREAFYSTRP